MRKRIVRQVIAMVLCVCMALGLFDGIPVVKEYVRTSTEAEAAAYGGDYRYWGQGQSDYQGMRDYGCWVVAQTKLLYETGIDRTLNPDAYYLWQRNNGFISGMNQLNGRNAPSIYARQKGKSLTYIGDWGAASSQLWFNINGGYYTIVKVLAPEGFTHYVMIANQLSKEKGILYCYDSWNVRRNTNPQPLSRYKKWYNGFVYRNDTVVTPNYQITTCGATNISNNDARILGSMGVLCWTQYGSNG